MAKFKFVAWLVSFFNDNAFFEFDWDSGNLTKSEGKHGIGQFEIESLFYADQIFPLGEQYQPQVDEKRYGIVAKSNLDRILFACFTLRNDKVRPISVRLANKAERGLYE